jgi:hypothetical protein
MDRNENPNKQQESKINKSKLKAQICVESKEG